MKELTKLEQRKHRIMQLKVQTQQRKQLIEISPETLRLFKDVSSLMNNDDKGEDQFLSFNMILQKVLEHWQQCTEVEIDRY